MSVVGLGREIARREIFELRALGPVALDALALDARLHLARFLDPVHRDGDLLRAILEGGSDEKPMRMAFELQRVE